MGVVNVGIAGKSLAVTQTEDILATRIRPPQDVRIAAKSLATTQMVRIFASRSRTPQNIGLAQTAIGLSASKQSVQRPPVQTGQRHIHLAAEPLRVERMRIVGLPQNAVTANAPSPIQALVMHATVPIPENGIGYRCMAIGVSVNRPVPAPLHISMIAQTIQINYGGYINE